MAGPTSADGDHPEDIPAWAREDAFPLKPTGSDFGLIDPKGGEHFATNAADLAQKVAQFRGGIDLVWTPDSPRLVVPEAVPALHQSLRQRQEKFAANDISDGRRMSLVFGAAVLWTGFAAWKNHGEDLHALYSSQHTGLAALLLFIFGLLPLYEGWKTRRRLTNTKPEDLKDEIPEAQFDSWLQRRKVPVTYFLLGCLALVGLAQLYVDWGSAGMKPSILRAGLLKLQALNYPEISNGGAWWRMMTAPMLHGYIVHLLMNAGGILYLGRRTETLARWPHLLIVFAMSAWIGGVASFYWMPNSVAVGSSGGLMGLLGFMLVFEKMHARLVPKPAQRRLLAGIVLMVIIGLLGMSFIDNAAHAGGLLAGMMYAGIVFPRSASFHRPDTMLRDKVVGGFVALMIIVVTCFTIQQVLGM
ncbi:hypothetical protein NT6N_35640 [Oceaniferula spumae]|uniref:Peptidase S54 rhomboid domain-containing protein n=1 Tax=Oceaniferula spumae TaxID=2979115 RepID=A0AAT9FRK1_9BACT